MAKCLCAIGFLPRKKPGWKKTKKNKKQIWKEIETAGRLNQTITTLKNQTSSCWAKKRNKVHGHRSNSGDAVVRSWMLQRVVLLQSSWSTNDYIGKIISLDWRDCWGCISRESGKNHYFPIKMSRPTWRKNVDNSSTTSLKFSECRVWPEWSFSCRYHRSWLRFPRKAKRQRKKVSLGTQNPNYISET